MVDTGPRRARALRGHLGAALATILMVIRPSSGGAFGHVARLSEALAARGHRIVIAGPHGHHRGRVAVEIASFDIPQRPSPAAAGAIRRLARLLADIEPDIVHAHGSQGPAIARLARIRAPAAPLVVSPHNFAFDNYFASRAERLAYRGVEQALAPLASVILCVCEDERRLACKLVPRRRTRLVHNGIDATEWDREPAPGARAAIDEVVAGRGPVLGAVTELHPRKGLPTLLEAMPEVLREHPAAVAVIAGDGPSRGAIESEVAARGLGDHVALLGHVADPRAVYSRADTLVLPSWSESFPYALLEAMAARLPIVATDVGGVGEAIVDGETGRLAPARDAGALAGAILSLLADPSRSRSLGDAARRRVETLFDLESMVEGTLGVYSELWSARSQRRRARTHFSGSAGSGQAT